MFSDFLEVFNFVANQLLSRSPEIITRHVITIRDEEKKRLYYIFVSVVSDIHIINNI